MDVTVSGDINHDEGLSSVCISVESGGSTYYKLGNLTLVVDEGVEDEPLITLTEIDTLTGRREVLYTRETELYSEDECDDRDKLEVLLSRLETSEYEADEGRRTLKQDYINEYKEKYQP